MDAEKKRRLVTLLVQERLSVRKAADALGVSHMTHKVRCLTFCLAMVPYGALSHLMTACRALADGDL